MELTEDQIKPLLSKEWLTKVDGGTSTPYLFKFHLSRMDLSCVLLITDTKTAWAEALNGQQFSRRWRKSNPTHPDHLDEDEEEAWRETNLELLSNIHTIGGLSDTSFEIVPSKYSDLAIEMECEGRKWRWETNSVGYRISAEIISKQLVFPLITANHVAFASTEPVNEMSDIDLEKAVDKTTRTARRALDTHVKNTVSKAKFSTVLRRITAMLNFAPDLPPVLSSIPQPDLTAKHIHKRAASPAPNLNTVDDASRSSTPAKVKPGRRPSPPSPQREPSPPRSGHPSTSLSASAAPASGGTGSETEDDDEPVLVKKPSVEEDARMASPSPPAPPVKTKARTPSPVPSPMAAPGEASPGGNSPGAGKKTAKKPRIDSSDSDSEDNSKARGSRPPARRGAKQPVKRGGKRF
ncbi:hypothetical protein BKA70DRAFT_221573 [Coprinopsis sp. MPI-PUGE-AT-0042]|nr:hypothetical protein BKA70DRAFT_221573 [Coprinopsis sp. MPI-PUGE-AT-0042]